MRRRDEVSVAECEQWRVAFETGYDFFGEVDDVVDDRDEAAFLMALDLVIGGKPNREGKPRRKSTKALIETAKRAGLDVTKLNPDGSVSTGQTAESTGNGQDNEWDLWEANRHAH